MAPIALHYLRKMLSDSNSYLVYILQFKVCNFIKNKKIIDESSSLLEKLITDLEKLYVYKDKQLILESNTIYN